MWQATGVVEAPLDRVSQHAGGTVEVDRANRMVAFQGGFKFRGELWFDRHEWGTAVTYKVYNVAPPSHRNKPLVRLQFWLSARLRIGMRGILRTIEARVS